MFVVCHIFSGDLSDGNYHGTGVTRRGFGASGGPAGYGRWQWLVDGESMILMIVLYPWGGGKCCVVNALGGKVYCVGVVIVRHSQYITTITTTLQNSNITISAKHSLLILCTMTVY